MNLRKVFIPAVAVAALLLGGCSQKVDYAAFHEKALNVEAHSYKTAVFKVESKNDNGSSNASYNLTYASGLWQADDGLISAGTAYATILNTNTAASVDEDDKTTYYFVGDGFKVEREGVSATYEKHGLLTGLNDGNGTTYSVSFK